MVTYKILKILPLFLHRGVLLFSQQLMDLPSRSVKFLVFSLIHVVAIATVFNASEENQKAHILDSDLFIFYKSTNSNNREFEFYVFEVATKNSMYLIINTVITCFGPAYDVC